MKIVRELQKKTSFVIAIIILIICMMIVIEAASHNEKPTSEIIMTKIEQSSELTTSKITFTGLQEYKDKGIKFINRSDFIMIYEATARVGIDIKKVKVNVSNVTKTVHIKIPDTEILDVKVNKDTIKYFDEKFALLNIDAKQDANDANSLAEESAKEKLDKMGILKMTNDQAESLIKGIIQDHIPKNYKIVIQRN
jgi:hypothetical protein